MEDEEDFIKRLSDLSTEELSRILSIIRRDKKDKTEERPVEIKATLSFEHNHDQNYEKGIEIGLTGTQLMIFSLRSFKFDIDITIDTKGHAVATAFNGSPLKIPVKI